MSTPIVHGFMAGRQRVRRSVRRSMAQRGARYVRIISTELLLHGVVDLEEPKLGWPAHTRSGPQAKARSEQGMLASMQTDPAA